jgi:hypothetical protein
VRLAAEAMQFTQGNDQEILEWLGMSEKPLYIELNDWIIKIRDDKIACLSPDNFNEYYEEIGMEGGAWDGRKSPRSAGARPTTPK